MLFTVDDEAVVFVNGTQVIDTKTTRDNDENAWQKATQLDVTSLLHSGANTIAVQVKNRLNQNGDPDARRLHRPPEGRHHHPRHEQRLEDEHHRPGRLAAARLR